jgi:hypothetical protein
MIARFKVAHTKTVTYTRADLMSLNHKERVAASCNRKRNFDHEGPEEHEVHNQISEPLRGLRAASW